MSLAAVFTLLVTLLVLVALVRESAPADVVFMGAVVLLAVVGILPPGEAFSGFANSAVIMVGALFVVAAALRETGALEFVSRRFLGKIRTERAALACIAIVATASSALLNNTPIVAMLLPLILDWCRKNNVAPSKLLIPLSFCTVLGGGCTLIGTSTNMVMNGLMIKRGLPSMGFFELSWAGVPCALIGVLYLITIGRHLLPQRKELLQQLGETRREYLVEMLVEPGCSLIGQSVEHAGLRRLPGLFLIVIEREGEAIGPVSPEMLIELGDRLVFTGLVETIVDLKKIPGLVPAADSMYDKTSVGAGRRLCEAVISPSSPLIGQTVRDADFRRLYNAAVVAVHRNGQRLPNKIGDIELRPGDTLLLQTGHNFTRLHRNNADFYLVSDVADSRNLRFERAWIAIAIFAGLIVAMVSGLLDPMIAAVLAAGLMVVTRCISTSDAHQAIEWPTLITIGASLGLGAALENSGAAAFLAEGLVDLTRPWGALAALAALYFLTMVLNELITNNGAAVLAFPFCIETAELLQVDSRPFLIAVTLAASFAFASPIGYQTHMMVYGPGGYRFSDFVRVGLPLNLLLWIVAVLTVPLFWSW